MADAIHVKSAYDLPTYEKRLRHVRSITLRNLQCKSYKGKDITKLQVYFTLHVNEKLKEFYKSEEIHGSLNPSWKSFDISRFEETIDTQAKSFVLRVWVQNGAVRDSVPHLLVDWTIHLSGLAFFSDKLQHADSHKRVGNMVVVGMFDKYFTVPQVPMAASQDVLLVVPSVVPRNSYTINSLSRIHTVLRAISQMKASVRRVHNSIQDKLLDSQEKTKKCSAREDMLLRVSQMKAELAHQMNTLQHQRDVSENCTKAKLEKSECLRAQFQQLEKNQAGLEEKRKTYFQTREKYIKENYQLLIRRKQLITELTTYIYPITETKDRKLCICGVHLPNSEDFQGKDDTMSSVALGYTCHLVQMMSQVLDFPVRYTMEHLSSRSQITDHIHPKLTDKDKIFPLFLKGKEKFQFNYGVFLLNKNISQLRFYCGLGTTDLRMTLPNIKGMLETRLGIKCEPSERARTEVRDTASLGSAERDETTSSVLSAGKNSITYPAEEALENALRNGNEPQETKNNPKDTKDVQQTINSLLPLADLSISVTAGEISAVENRLKPVSGTEMNLKIAGFDSAENSSCGSFPDQANGVISYDRTFSLSPSPGSTDQNLLLTSAELKSAGSPSSLMSGDLLLADDMKNSGKLEVAEDGQSNDLMGSTSDKFCDNSEEKQRDELEKNGTNSSVGSLNGLLENGS